MVNALSEKNRWVLASIAIAALFSVLLLVIKDSMQSDNLVKVEGYVPWSEETLNLAETLPVQSGGRVKPLSSYAGFRLLALNGKREVQFQGDGKKYKLKPTAWLLDTLFRPQFAVQYPSFRVENSEVLVSIGLPERAKSDRYSYKNIFAGREKLIESAALYEKLLKDKRSPVEQQTIDLAYQVRAYESLLSYFSFAREGVELPEAEAHGVTRGPLAVSQILLLLQGMGVDVGSYPREDKPLDPRLGKIMEQIERMASAAKFELFILPPDNPADSVWKSAGQAIEGLVTHGSADKTSATTDIKMLEDLARAASEGDGTFRERLLLAKEELVRRATSRGEYKSIVLEAKYYRMNWFLNALVLFLVASLCAVAMWTLGGGMAAKVFGWATFGFTSVGWVCCATAIVQRCVIMQRPPIGNLYDTIIFVATAMVLFALIVEWLTKRRFALGAAPVIGLVLIILARRFEVGDPKDHMDKLVAVLNSNFWLTIHVITIALGYSAGLLSAFLACIYVLLRGLKLDGGDKTLRKSLTKAVYGMVCLTLLFSLIGTVLGGIWANYSWGRFWGWDPKENGALLIVIWMLVILHARMGGYIKEWGTHLCAVFTACIITFSWWHVNFLNTGLHNYGFTAGKSSIWIFYGIILLFLVFGFAARALEKYHKPVDSQNI